MKLSLKTGRSGLIAAALVAALRLASQRAQAAQDQPYLTADTSAAVARVAAFGEGSFAGAYPGPGFVADAEGELFGTM